MNITDAEGDRLYTGDDIRAILKAHKQALRNAKEAPTDPSVQEFFAAKCSWDDQGRIKASELHDIYRNWCADNGHGHLDIRRFGHALTKMGFWIERGSGGVRYRRGLTVNGIAPARTTLVPKWMAVTDEEVRAILSDI